MAKEHEIAASDDIRTGEMTPVRLGRSTIIVTRLPCGTLRAVSGRCPHMGANLQFGCITGMAQGPEYGKIEMTRENEVLRCPWHGFEFDLRTGDPAVPAPRAQAMKLRLYETREHDGRVYVSA
ncbi:MAG: Rieske (2Fe-2S) protein [Pseudomonadota bacterium]